MVRFLRFAIAFIGTACLFLNLTYAQGLQNQKAFQIFPEKSEVYFIAKAIGYNVKGQFKKFSGEVQLSLDDLTKSKIQVQVDTASVDSGIKMRDDHLRSAEFFDSQNFQTANFRSLKIVESGPGKYTMTGKLIIKNIPKTVTLEFTSKEKYVDSSNRQHLVFEAKTKLNRRDFDITYTGEAATADSIQNNGQALKPSNGQKPSGGFLNKLKIGVTSDEVFLAIILDVVEAGT